MASHEVVHLGAGQWVEFIAILAAAIGRAVYLAATWCFQRTHPSWPVSRSLAVAFLRQTGHFSLTQIRALTPPTSQGIREYCSFHKLPLISRRVPPHVSHVPEATLHFINCKLDDQTPIVLFCHGGGYVNPIIKEGHIPYALHAARTAPGVDGHVALLEYTLAPALKYPGQLIQLVAALRLLLTYRRPDQIILGGDSAGGNLVLALLAHLIKQHPQVPPVELARGSRLRAVLLLSPWVGFDPSAPSFHENANTDYLTRDNMGDFTSTWQPNAEHVWAQPLKGGSAFWAQHRLPVEKCLITAGNWEVLRDQVAAMAEQMGAVRAGTDERARVHFALNADEVHVQCVFDEIFDLHDSNTAKSVDAWLVRV